MKKDKKDVSTCPAGKEQYTVFWEKGEQKVQYDYRAKDGELFSVIENTLEHARDARNAWLSRKEFKKQKPYKLDDVVLYPDEGGDLVPVVMKDGIACTLSQKGLEKFLSEALQKIKDNVHIPDFRISFGGRLSIELEAAGYKQEGKAIMINGKEGAIYCKRPCKQMEQK